MKIPYIALILAALLSVSALAERVNYQSSARIPNVKMTDAQEHEAMQKVTKISLAEAQAAAQKVAPNARMTKAELDSEDGNVIYEVEFFDNGLERTVIIDAGNGKVLSNTVERD